MEYLVCKPEFFFESDYFSAADCERILARVDEVIASVDGLMSNGVDAACRVKRVVEPANGREFSDDELERNMKADIASYFRLFERLGLSSVRLRRHIERDLRAPAVANLTLLFEVGGTGSYATVEYVFEAIWEVVVRSLGLDLQRRIHFADGAVLMYRGRLA